MLLTGGENDAIVAPSKVRMTPTYITDTAPPDNHTSVLNAGVDGTAFDEKYVASAALSIA